MNKTEGNRWEDKRNGAAKYVKTNLVSNEMNNS